MVTEVKASEAAAPAVQVKAPTSIKLGNLSDGFYPSTHTVTVMGKSYSIGRAIKPTRAQKATLKAAAGAGIDKQTGMVNVDAYRESLRESIVAAYRGLAATYAETGLKLRDQQGDSPEGAVIALQKNLDAVL